MLDVVEILNIPAGRCLPCLDRNLDDGVARSGKPLPPASGQTFGMSTRTFSRDT